MLKNAIKKFWVGFSLLELLIVLAIVGILSIIAYPSYSAYVVKVRRANAATALQDLAASMESYYNDNYSYSGAALANLKISNIDASLYKLQIVVATDVGYRVIAKPFGQQATADKDCGTLSLDQQGNRAITGSGVVAKCWGG
ncbi:MAG: type IV pilin protein [Gammaproteobacteria bacterium]|nr:type IV pilin protein [Gammaproteobacteria bacterium]